jgi:hypothetical protein
MTEARPTVEPRPRTPPSLFVVAVGLFVALWCVGFAAMSVWFEFTDHFGDGEDAVDPCFESPLVRCVCDGDVHATPPASSRAGSVSAQSC